MAETLEQVKEKAIILSETMTKQSTALIIDSNESLGLAGTFLFQARVQVQIIKAAFAPHKNNAHKTHADLCKSEKDQLAPFEGIQSILGPKVLKYTTDLEKASKKEQEQREAQQRLTEAKAKKEAEERRQEQVDSLMEEGDFEKAEEIISAPTPEPVAAYVPKVEKAKVVNTGTRKVWKGRVLDFSKVPDKFKVIDQQAVNRYATALKSNAKEPGLEFYQDTQLTGK